MTSSTSPICLVVFYEREAAFQGQPYYCKRNLSGSGALEHSYCSALEEMAGDATKCTIATGLNEVGICSARGSRLVRRVAIIPKSRGGGRRSQGRTCGIYWFHKAEFGDS